MVSKENVENFEHFEEYIGNRILVVKKNECAEEARRCDSSVLTRKGARNAFSELDAMMFEVAEYTRRGGGR